MIRGIPRSSFGNLRRCLIVLASIGWAFASVVSLSPEPPLSGIQLPPDHKSILPASGSASRWRPRLRSKSRCRNNIVVSTPCTTRRTAAEVDFTAAYSEGFIAGWGSILPVFGRETRSRRSESGRVEDLVELVQSINGVGGEPYYPGSWRAQRLVAMRCKRWRKITGWFICQRVRRG